MILTTTASQAQAVTTPIVRVVFDEDWSWSAGVHQLVLSGLTDGRGTPVTVRCVGEVLDRFQAGSYHIRYDFTASRSGRWKASCDHDAVWSFAPLVAGGLEVHDAYLAEGAPVHLRVVDEQGAVVHEVSASSDSEQCGFIFLGRARMSVNGDASAASSTPSCSRVPRSGITWT